ncbi:MerR family transcriptional regulator [Microlunatus sp. Gsoil 973]|uniref:MerR family transcriptional regulator n=1 Tax=Microlunatus sp. Gsoil 973 TaxID=2672569 RepID=UPI0012B4F383|nr:MerR family transcriptional regulator [Microlunatus sp. Gsoil 973]QGN32688.1 MerR family transcriptional regulator [Microlunatus sp. Gsoil 973]
MRIGELADRTGVSVRSVRYYEQQGLLATRRTSNGYREFDEDDLQVVDQIRRLLGIGFTLEDTRPFVECLQSGAPTGDSCPDSVVVYQRKLAELDHQIALLGRRRTELAQHLARSCAGCAPTPEELHAGLDE